MLAELYRGESRSGRYDRAIDRARAASGSAIASASCPPDCRAASGSASRSPGRSSASRACCCATSPPATSTARTPLSVLDLFDELREQGLTIVVITHDSDVAAHARRHFRMVDGRLTESSVTVPAPHAATRPMRPPSSPKSATPVRSCVVRDLADESLAGVFARPARTALTTLGTVLGIASLVATLGISAPPATRSSSGSASSQRPRSPCSPGPARVAAATRVATRQRRGTSGVLPWDVEDRLDRLNGVVASGAVADCPNPGGIRTVPFIDPTTLSERTLPVVRRVAGPVRRSAGHIAAGRWFDSGHVDRARSRGVLGVDIAVRARHHPRRQPARRVHRRRPVHRDRHPRRRPARPWPHRRHHHPEQHGSGPVRGDPPGAGGDRDRARRRLVDRHAGGDGAEPERAGVAAASARRRDPCGHAERCRGRRQPAVPAARAGVARSSARSASPTSRS